MGPRKADAEGGTISSDPSHTSLVEHAGARLVWTECPPEGKAFPRTGQLIIKTNMSS